MSHDLLHKKLPAKQPAAQAQELATAAPQQPVQPSQQRPPHEIERGRSADAKGAEAKDREGMAREGDKVGPAARPELRRQASRPRLPGAKVRFFEARPHAETAGAAQRQGTQAGPGGNLWRAWVENAYAAWKDGKGAGQAGDVLSALTGQRCQVFSTQQQTAELWLAMLGSLAAGRPVAALSHGGGDDPDEPRRRKWRWFSVVAVSVESGAPVVEVADAEASEVVAWPAFLERFEEVVVAE